MEALKKPGWARQGGCVNCGPHRTSHVCAWHSQVFQKAREARAFARAAEHEMLLACGWTCKGPDGNGVVWWHRGDSPSEPQDTAVRLTFHFDAGGE